MGWANLNYHCDNQPLHGLWIPMISITPTPNFCGSDWDIIYPMPLILLYSNSDLSLLDFLIWSYFCVFRFLPFVPNISWQRVSHSRSATVGESNGERRREIALWFVVIWSLILTDPYQPRFHSSLFTALLHQTKWLVVGHRGFVFINKQGNRLRAKTLLFHHHQSSTEDDRPV